MINAVSDSGQKIITNGLVLHVDAGQLRSYPGSGTAWNDLSTSGQNGTLTNGPTFSSGNGGSIVFDGTNDQVNFPSGFANFNSGITIEAWVNENRSNKFYSRILDFSIRDRVSMIQLGREDTTLNFFFGMWNNGGSLLTIVSQNNEYSINTWHHLTGTADGTNWTIYKNGSQVRQIARATLPDNDTRTQNYIGNSSFGSDYFSGNISIARLYNRALSATEILQNFNADKIRFGL